MLLMHHPLIPLSPQYLVFLTRMEEKKLLSLDFEENDERVRLLVQELAPQVTELLAQVYADQ